MKCGASHDEHFDILHAQNGAAHEELWHDERSPKISWISGLSRNFTSRTKTGRLGSSPSLVRMVPAEVNGEEEGAWDSGGPREGREWIDPVEGGRIRATVAVDGARGGAWPDLKLGAPSMAASFCITGERGR